MNTMSKSQIAWPAWQALSVVARADIIESWSHKIVSDNTDNLGNTDNSNKTTERLAQMIQYQNVNGLALLADTKIMPGPTGETNELYSAGRGVFLVTTDDANSDSSETTELAVVAYLSAALLAGNCVILAMPQLEDARRITAQVEHAGFPSDTVTIIAYDDLEQTIRDINIAGIAYVGMNEKAVYLNQQLAQKEGQIGAFISETRLDDLITVNDSHLILRFITERTRTINITAVGGNANLLALGSGDH